ncbi:Transcriptional regulator, LysR family protein [Minicystis rosea]|nr:Transcriptional regulator, LysR family protein [Minicystis rosea]
MEQIGIQRLTGIVAFARAASLGSYTAAARALGLSPSAVSKSVQRLEQHLSLTLFARSTRALVLTPEGRDLHERVLRLLEEAEAIEQAAVAARGEPAGALRISAPVPVGIHVLAPALPRFRERYPKVVIDLRLSDRLSDLVEEGIDVAVRVGELTDSRLVARALAPHGLCAVAAPDYLRRRGEPNHPRELADHACVNFRFQSSGALFRWFFTTEGEETPIAPKAGITADSSEAVLAIVAAGGGIAISPTVAAAPWVQRGAVVPVLRGFVRPRSTMTALWPETRRNNPAVKAFVKYLIELFPSPTPWDALVERFAPEPPPGRRPSPKGARRASGTSRTG